MTPEPQDMQRYRPTFLSPGHNPPRYVDKVIPTFETTIHADGGPGKQFPRAQGTNPWIAGSFTLGTNRVWNIVLAKMQASSPNVWFKLRHNHSGTNATAPGGTLDEWFLSAAGRQVDVGETETPLRSIRSSGTLFLYGFGAGSVSGTTTNRVHKTLGTRAVDRFSAMVRGYVL